MRRTMGDKDAICRKNSYLPAMAARPTEPRFFGRMAWECIAPSRLQAKTHVQREIHSILLDFHLLRM